MSDENFLQELEFAIFNAADGFVAFCKQELGVGLSDDRFDALIGYLEDLPEKEPLLAVQLSKVMLEYFSDDENPKRQGLTWHFRMLSILHQPQPAELLKSLNAALSCCANDPVNYRSGHMICQNFKNMVSVELLGEDSLLIADKLMITFYQTAELIEEALPLMLHAASVFSRQNAFQSAYRILNEAEQMVVAADRSDLHLEVIVALANACTDEGDLEYAAKAYEAAFSALAEAGSELDDTLLFNFGVIQLRREKTQEALILFSSLQQRETFVGYMELRVGYHIGICLKDLGDWDKAEAAFSLLLPLADELAVELADDFDLYLCDLAVDFHLCYASILAHNQKCTDAMLHLRIAIENIELSLQFTIRPHFRGGIRQQYHNRILTVTGSVWQEATMEDFLLIMAYLKKNTQSDWLAILSWAEYLYSQTGIPDLEKQKIAKIIDALHEHSGMVIGHFREKYDDPFEWAAKIERIFSEENNQVSRLPWQDLALAVEDINKKYGTLAPFHFNNLTLLSNAASDRLNEDNALIFVYLSKVGYTLYFLTGQTIEKKDFEQADMRDYLSALLEYRNGGERNDFTGEFRVTTKFIDEELTPVWERLKIQDKAGIYIFPGILDAFFPLAQSCLLNADIKAKMADGGFTVVQCPIMFPQKKPEGQFEQVEILINEKDALPLFREEASAVSKIFPQANISYVTNDTEINMARANAADILHFVTHGKPISNFTDPVYASLSGGVFSLLTLKGFHSSKTRLYVLNSCNAADTISGTQFKISHNHEIFGYITVLLQNRQTMIIAPQWQLMDTLAYVFSLLFYGNLAVDHDIKKAFSKSIHTLATGDTTFFRNLVHQIEDDQLRAAKEELFSQSTGFPFNSLFLSGSFNLYSLV